MIKRVVRSVTIALLALAFVWSLAAGAAQPTTVYGADPTPTPVQTNSEPGGHGGGGG
jgi:hypothetical protein